MTPGALPALLSLDEAMRGPLLGRVMSLELESDPGRPADSERRESTRQDELVPTLPLSVLPVLVMVRTASGLE